MFSFGKRDRRQKVVAFSKFNIQIDNMWIGFDGFSIYEIVTLLSYQLKLRKSSRNLRGACWTPDNELLGTVHRYGWYSKQAQRVARTS